MTAEFTGKTNNKPKEEILEIREVLEAQSFINELNDFLLNYPRAITNKQSNYLYNAIHELGNILLNIEAEGPKVWQTHLKGELRKYKKYFKSLKQNLSLSSYSSHKV